MTLQIRLKVALGKGPNDTVVDGDFTDLSDRVLAFDMQRGRQDRTGDYEPGTISVELDNSDRAYDPLWPRSEVWLPDGQGLPLSPVRVDGSRDGGTTWHRLFTGYLGPECWKPTRYRVDGKITCRLEAVDRLGVMAQTALPSSVFAAQVQWLAPDWWIRGIGGDVTAGDTDNLRDSSGNDYLSEISAGVGDVMFEVASMVEGDSDSAMTLEAGVAGYTDATALTAATADVTMCCVWRGTPDGVDQEIMRQRNGSTVRWRVECQTTGDIVAIIYDSGGTATDFVAAPANPNDPGGRWDDDTPHIIFVQIDGGTRLRIRVDEQSDSVTASIPATVAGRVIFGGGSQTASFDEVAFWTRLVSNADVDRIASTFMGTEPFDDDTLAQRINRWWDLTDMPRGGSDVVLHEGDLEVTNLHGLRSIPGSLAEAIQNTAASFRGVAFTQRDGALRVRTHEALYNTDWDAFYLDQIAALTDEAAPTYDVPVVRRSRPQFTGVRLDRVVNVSKVTWRDLTFTMRNDASVARYGERTREWTSELADVLQAVALADAEVNDAVFNLASPPPEIEAVTVYPSIDANAAEVCFETLELEQRVFVFGDEGELSWYFLAHVIGERWRWERGTDVTVELSLADIRQTPGLVWSGYRRFDYTGGAQTFVVPTGVLAIDVEVYGASGADYDETNVGGLGGQVIGAIDVTPGETLHVYVGGAGSGATGGWNGGGDGGSGGGRGGGGATDIRQGGTGLGNRLAIAGGGGGAGTGGSGGGDGLDGYGDAPGEGGTALAGGAGGVGNTSSGSAGTSGDGGDGGAFGGGGGGGRYGGGGGGSVDSVGSGGGGGMSMPATGTTAYADVNSGDGYVIFTWAEGTQA